MQCTQSALVSERVKWWNRLIFHQSLSWWIAGRKTRLRAIHDCCSNENWTISGVKLFFFHRLARKTPMNFKWLRSFFFRPKNAAKERVQWFELNYTYTFRSARNWMVGIWVSHIFSRCSSEVDNCEETQVLSVALKDDREASPSFVVFHFSRALRVNE